MTPLNSELCIELSTTRGLQNARAHTVLKLMGKAVLSVHIPMCGTLGGGGGGGRVNRVILTEHESMVWYSVCGVLRWGSAQVVSSTCAQVKSCGCGQGQRRRGTRERQVGSTLAAEAQAICISATCAASRTPARAIVIGEGRGARPRATDEQLVGGGQGVGGLPSRRAGIGRGAWEGHRAGAAQVALRARPSEGWGPLHARYARKTCPSCS